MKDDDLKLIMKNNFHFDNNKTVITVEIEFNLHSLNMKEWNYITMTRSSVSDRYI